MTFEEIDACAKTLFSKENDFAMWPYIDEGDRSYWRKLAIEELKRTQLVRPPVRLDRVSFIRIALAWACFGIGDVISHTLEPVLGRWFEWPYRVYNALMVWSGDLQSNDQRGPWGRQPS